MPSARVKRARESDDDTTTDNGARHVVKQSDTADLRPASPPAPCPTSQSHSERLQAVFDWALQHGASAPKWRLGCGEYGWGVFATADIAADEELASIPLTLVLTHQRADDSPVGAAVRELNDRLQSSSKLPHPAVLISPRTTLYLYMVQQLTGPTAFFQPYLASLPAPCSPLLWPPASLSYLTGTNLHAAIPNKLRQLRARYDNCVPLLCELFPAVFDSSAFTFDRFLWSHTQLTSRGFPVRVGEPAAEDRVTAGELRAEGTKRPNERIGCLLPLLDMTNHRTLTGITWTTTASTTARVSFRTGYTTTVSAGSEVFNNYGAKSNEEFLLGYGFCIDDNVYDEYTVQLGGVGGDSEYMLDRLQLPWRDKGYYLTADSTPEQLLAVLRVAVMTEAEREVYGWQWVEQQGTVGHVSVRNEVAMLDQLCQLLMSRLIKLGHDTVEQADAAERQDRERLADAHIAEDERLALTYKKGQRYILIQRIKHTQQAKANILTRTPPLPVYRLSSSATQSDQLHLQLLAAAWERAINPVTPPSSVLSIPSPLLITQSSLRQSETFAPVLDYAAGLSVHQEVTLFILHQLQLATESPYAPLLSFLHHSAHPSRSLPRLVESSTEYADAADVYEQLFPALSEADPELFSTSVHTRDNWLWAHYLVHRHTVLLPTAEGELAWTFLPVTTMPLPDVLWRGRVGWDEKRLTVSYAEGVQNVRVVYDADVDDDSRSVWTKGDYVVGSHSIIRVAASSLFTVTFMGSLSSAHQALFALFQSWDDEQAEIGHFYVSQSGVCGGLLAWCRLLSMTADDIAVLMQQQNSTTADNIQSTTAIGSGVVLDTDERTEDEQETNENTTPSSEHLEPAAVASEADVGADSVGEIDEQGMEEEEDKQAAHEQSALPRRNMRQLLLSRPYESPQLLDWQRIRTAGWRQLHSALLAYTEVEAANMQQPEEGSDKLVVEVPWERLQDVHQRDRLNVLRACVEWAEGQMSSGVE